MYSYKKETQNGEEKIKRLVSWYNGEKNGPIQIDAELHKRCNLMCLPCSRQATNFNINADSIKNELPVKKWVSIVKEAKELGVLIWNIEGAGEPFANKYLIFPVMKEVKNQGIYGIVTTNGTLFTEEDIKTIVEIGWNRIHFSLDGHNAELNDYIRGKGNFEKSVKAIQLLNKWKENLGVENPMLNINTVINSKNYKFLPELVEFAHEMKADFIFTEPLITYHDRSKHLKLNQVQSKELNNYIQKAKILAEKYQIDNNFATKDKNLDNNLIKETSKINTVILDDVKNIESDFLSVPCFKPWDNMAIKYNGLSGHCGLIEIGDNITKKSLKEIWYGKTMETVRKNMLEKKLPNHCKNCCPSDITQRRRLRKELVASAK